MGELMTAHVSPALKTYATWIGQMSCVPPIQKAQPSAEIADTADTQSHMIQAKKYNEIFNFIWFSVVLRRMFLYKSDL